MELLKEYETRLESHFTDANDTDIHGGMTWYKDAHFKCKRISKILGVDFNKFVAIVAILSPQKKWEKNIEEAVTFIRKGMKAKLFATKRQKALCFKVLNSSNIKDLHIGGMKVTSFYKNILNPFKSDTVTVDRHAMKSIGFTKSLTPKQYGIIELAHKNVAKKFNIRPHELQAICWIVVRNK